MRFRMLYEEQQWLVLHCASSSSLFHVFPATHHRRLPPYKTPPTHTLPPPIGFSLSCELFPAKIHKKPSLNHTDLEHPVFPASSPPPSATPQNATKSHTTTINRFLPSLRPLPGQKPQETSLESHKFGASRFSDELTAAAATAQYTTKSHAGTTNRFLPFLPPPPSQKSK